MLFRLVEVERSRKNLPSQITAEWYIQDSGGIDLPYCFLVEKESMQLKDSQLSTGTKVRGYIMMVNMFYYQNITKTNATTDMS